MKKIILTISLSGALVSPLTANAIDLVSDLSSKGQNVFNLVSGEAAKLNTYNRESYANSMGIIGFNVSVDSKFLKLNADALNDATKNDISGEIIVPMGGIQVDKGLPMGFDVGVAYKQDPTGNVTIFSGEVRKELISGGLVSPSLSTGINYSIMKGGDILNGENLGIDFTVSKGFLMATPYIGATYNVSKVTDPKGNFKDYKNNFMNYYAGVNLNLLIDFTAQYERVNNSDSLTIKAGFRF